MNAFTKSKIYIVANKLPLMTRNIKISMENIPYHFYFILFLCLIAAVNFVLARYTTHAIYNKTSKVTQTDNQQDVSNDSTDEADTSS